MCYNCGCHIPQDDMGSPDNITEQTLAHLAKHWDKTLPETKEELYNLLQTNDPELKQDHHLKQMFEKAALAWGQSIKEAYKNTHNLLKSELKK